MPSLPSQARTGSAASRPVQSAMSTGSFMLHWSKLRLMVMPHEMWPAWCVLLERPIKSLGRSPMSKCAIYLALAKGSG